MSTNVQMNVRLKKPDKTEGDSALKNAGYTPSEVIQKFWKYARKNKQHPEKIKQIINMLDETDNDKELKRKLKIIKKERELCDSLFADSTIMTSSNAELRKIAYSNRNDL